MNKDPWYLVDMAIKAFISEYPKQWFEFQNDLKSTRVGYNLAEGDLGKAGFRNTLSFPVVINKYGDEDSLFPVIKKMFKREGINFPKDKKYYNEFIRRYPDFIASEKV